MSPPEMECPLSKRLKVCRPVGRLNLGQTQPFLGTKLYLYLATHRLIADAPQIHIIPIVVFVLQVDIVAHGRGLKSTPHGN